VCRQEGVPTNLFARAKKSKIQKYSETRAFVFRISSRPQKWEGKPEEFDDHA
jgi:hypothetical protein